MKFLRNLLATIVGLFVFCFIMVMALVIIASLAGQEQTVEISSNSILHLKTDRQILEREREDPLEGLGLIPGVEHGAIGLIELKEAIEHAKDDDKIKGIWLESPMLMTGYASAHAIRQSLLDFKESGKFIVAASEYYTEGGYYLASCADEIIANPDYGFLELNGINIEVTYFKGTLDKLGIEPYIFRAGDYKDAVEPFMRKDMSEASREHLSSLIEDIHKNFLTDISESRGIDYNTLRNISDSALVRTAADALHHQLVDRLAYHDEVVDLFRERLEIEEDEDLPLVSYRKYKDTYQHSNASKNRIAVIVANGQIMGGKGDDQTIGSDTFAKEIREARESDGIKAIVLRINSPGGSASASDIIWREIVLAAREKPVIASLGDMAASGGYYMAMACDTIVTMPNTITGSIGAFGMFFNAGEFLEDKLGITTDNVKTGTFSDLYSLTQPKSEYELNIFQQQIEHVYETFLSKAAEGRSLPKESIATVASGRVWTGQQAVDNQLADVIGELDDAVKLAAEKAGIADDYRVRYYPVQKSPIEELLTSLSGEYEAAVLKGRLGSFYPYYHQAQKALDMQGIQMRLPFELNWAY
jgi:protease-4